MSADGEKALDAGTAPTVPVESILAGIGALERKELAWLLAALRGSDFSKVLLQVVRSWTIGEGDDAPRVRMLEDSVREEARRIEEANASHVALRLELWAILREHLDCIPKLPLSLRSARMAAGEVAGATATVLGRTLEDPDKAPVDGQTSPNARDGSVSEVWSWARRLWERIGGGRPLSFDEVVRIQAARLLVRAAGEDGNAGHREVVREELLRALSDDRAAREPLLEELRKAVARGNWSAISILSTAGGLGALAAVVEVTGFGAYVLAAKLSAILPLVSGVGAVSTLAVLANPLFAPLAVGAVTLFGKRRVEARSRPPLAASVVTLLALRGLAAREVGLARCLDAFKQAEIADRRGRLRHRLDLRNAVRAVYGGELPATPACAPGVLAFPASRLHEPARAGDSVRRPAFAATTQDVAGIGLLTVGEILYAASTIDPRVIEAVDFARSEEITDPWSFVETALGVLAGDEESRRGEENRLSGYVAERLVALQLAAEGHEVAFPDHANQPGYDIVVDGQEFQIKCLVDERGLYDHFRDYPDIPVFVNEEIFEKIRSSDVEWKDLVYPVAGFTHRHVREILDTSLDAAEEVADLDVPVFAMAAASVRALANWWTGRRRLEEMPLELSLHLASRGLSSLAGGLVGKFAGLSLFGPAGGIVFANAGALAALVGAPRLRRSLEMIGAGEWLEQLDQRARDCLAGSRTILEKRKRSIDRKLERMQAPPRSEEALWLAMRLLDDRVFCCEALCTIAELERSRDPVERGWACLEAVCVWSIHPAALRDEMARLANVLKNRPGMVERARNVWNEGSAAVPQGLKEVPRMWSWGSAPPERTEKGPSDRGRRRNAAEGRWRRNG